MWAKIRTIVKARASRDVGMLQKQDDYENNLISSLKKRQTCQWLLCLHGWASRCRKQETGWLWKQFDEKDEQRQTCQWWLFFGWVRFKKRKTRSRMIVKTMWQKGWKEVKPASDGLVLMGEKQDDKNKKQDDYKNNKTIKTIWRKGWNEVKPASDGLVLVGGNHHAGKRTSQVTLVIIIIFIRLIMLLIMTMIIMIDWSWAEV